MKNPFPFYHPLILASIATTLLSSVAADQTKVTSFEGESSQAAVKALDATTEIIGDEGVTDGSKALRITFTPDAKTSGIDLIAEEPWDCRRLGNYHLRYDAKNPGEHSIHLHAVVNGPKGGNFIRSVSIPAKSSGSYYFELKGEGLKTDFGLRDDPPSLDLDATRMITRIFKQQADFPMVKKIRFYVSKNIHAKTLILDNIHFASSPEPKPGYLTGFVDKFGQNAKADFDWKITSEEELKAAADKELRELAVSDLMPDRSRWGGWKDGPKLKATGYFRTEKYKGKWAIVDPDGYLFFSSGIANVRMANSTTFTGVDYRDDSVREIDPEDVTPEDSQGMVAVPRSIQEDDYEIHPVRRAMFEWLPDYDDPLAKHYSYRRETHHGPVPHGQTFSFYQANLERRYGETFRGSYLTKWRDVTIDRMHDWGFTSFGNWAAEEFYHAKRLPYFANGWIIGDFKTLSSGADYWRPMPDPFDPEFARRAKLTTEIVAEEVMGSPWCVGVFLDNEMSWGNEDSLRSQHGIVLDALSKGTGESPAAAAFIKALKEKYPDITQLNQKWGTSVESWDQLAAGMKIEDEQLSEGMLEDLSELKILYAHQYFRVVSSALKDVLPNHLYLGPRLTTWGMSWEVRKAAKEYVDLMGFNYYREGLGSADWHFLEEMDLPCLIGEFHMGSTDSGLPSVGLIHSADQKDRAKMWTEYMTTIIESPYFVGAHWFQYFDSPITGRAHDGENYNVGFVTVTDTPYEEMIKAAKELHGKLYPMKFGEVEE
ncbi:MAG: agarase [Verrucomicrobiota bacterium]